jgi:O-antigen ligase
MKLEKSMRRLMDWFKNKETRLENWVVVLTGLWLFLIPFGRGAQVPVAALAAIGLTLLFQTRGQCARSPAAKGFLLLCALYLIPIALSMFDAPALKYPMRVFWIGVGSALAGIAIIHGASSRKSLQRIGLLLAAGVAFWLLYAASQVIFGCDLFRESWQGAEGRICGPFTNKNIMGYYAGPYSALLLMFAWQKKWKPLWLIALLLFTSIIILLNNSRGGWVMYAIVATGFVWKAFIAPRKHKLLICAGIILLGAVVLGGLYFTSSAFRARADQTLVAFQGTEQALNEALTNRIPVWEAAWAAIKDHPINGSGARNFRVVALEYWPIEKYGAPGKVGNTFYPHQLVLEYAFGTGLIGIIGLILSAGLCLRWWFRAAPEQRTLACGYGLVLLADYFPINTHRSMFASLEALSIWILIALYCATIQFKETSAEL